MGYFVVQVLLWTFAIYGFIMFFQEFIIDVICAFIIAIKKIKAVFKNFIAKFSK